MTSTNPITFHVQSNTPVRMPSHDWLTRYPMGLATRIIGLTYPPGRASIDPIPVRGMLDLNEKLQPAFDVELTDERGQKSLVHFPIYRDVFSSADVVTRCSADHLVRMGYVPTSRAEGIATAGGEPGPLLRLCVRKRVLEKLLGRTDRDDLHDVTKRAALEGEIPRLQGWREYVETAIAGLAGADEISRPSRVAGLKANFPNAAANAGPIPLHFEAEEFALATASGSGAVKATLADTATLTAPQLQSKLTTMLDKVVRNGTGQVMVELKCLLEQLTIQRLAVETLVSLTTAQSTDAGLLVEIARTAELFDSQATIAVAAVAELERGLGSMYAFFVESEADGEATDVYVINSRPFATPASAADGETAIFDATGKQSLFERSVNEKGEILPVFFVPEERIMVFQNMAFALAVGGCVGGLVQLKKIARRAHRGGFIAIANIDGDDLKDFDRVTTPQKLGENYSGIDLEFRSVMTVANGPLLRRMNQYDASMPAIDGSFAHLGKLYANGKMRYGLSIATPTTQPGRDKFAPIYSGLEHPDAAVNIRDIIGVVPMAMMTVASNVEANGMVTVLSSSRTAWSGGDHSLESQIGEILSRRLVAQILVSKFGTASNDEQARIVGRALNYALQGFSGKSEAALWTAACCDHKRSSIIAEVKRDADGNPVLDDSGKAILTGRQVQRHFIEVKTRRGVSSFEVHIS